MMFVLPELDRVTADERSRIERPPLRIAAVLMAGCLSDPGPSRLAQLPIGEPLHSRPAAAALDFAKIDAGSAA